MASFLTQNLGVDWRLGAEAFEEALNDYDVYSNWGNWLFAAGITGGRVNVFNITKQSRDYDADVRARRRRPGTRSLWGSQCGAAATLHSCA